MSSDVLALLIGTILGVSALAFVLYPLFFGEPFSPIAEGTADRVKEESAIVALREIEFDRATGKLSEPDYTELRSAYEPRALRELREAKQAASTAMEEMDPIEARVRAYRMAHRECPTCGLRPEPDAIYCSTCGSFLDRVCPACSTPIREPGATFCSTCGVPLARRTAI